ncbi:DNA cytosine methyltransferase, partial [Pseudomonas viridiflava]|uniref:DNA cytosine methyltransferase n=2 Tax=Pseudomonas TaxID=286 RepID=UPI0013DA2779
NKECWNNIVTKNAKHIIERYKHIPQGGNWEDIPLALMQNYKDATRCHTGIYRRLKADEPSVVIGNFRKNMLIHPWQDRGLSVREAARLQSFPDAF